MRHLMNGVRCSIFQFSAAVVVLLVLLSSVSPARAAVVRVPRDFQSIQAAIDSTQPGDEAWVSGGTYAESITLRSGVGVYGGFSGNETSHDERDWVANPTILDGTSCIGGKQAQHVVTMDRVTSVTLDGFTVKGGRAKDIFPLPYEYSAGAGIYTTKTLYAIIRNCQITENASDSGYGSGIATFNSELYMVGCQVIRNIKPSSLISSSGALFAFSVTTATNCSFSEHEGMGLRGLFSDIAICDSIFAHNSQGNFVHTNGNHSIVFERCKFIENCTPDNIWATLYFNNGQNVVKDSIFLGNHAVALYGSVTAIQCNFINNFCAIDGDRITAINSIFCGNNETYKGHIWNENPYCLRNVVLVNNAKAPIVHLENSLVQDNLFTSCNGENTVFLNNPNLTASASLNCIFFHNNSLNPSKVSGFENLVADPQFVSPRKGHWTSAPAYDAAATQTILTDAYTTFMPNELAGKLIKVNSSVPSSCYVLSNTEHTVTVYGHAEDKATLGGEWLIMDYHVAGGSSPCVDRGMTIPDLTTDFEGRPRPLIGAYDIGIYEYPGVEGPGGYVDLAAESAWFYQDQFYEGPDVTFGYNIRNWGDRNSTTCLFTVSVDGVEKIRETLAPDSRKRRCIDSSES